VDMYSGVPCYIHIGIL